MRLNGLVAGEDVKRGERDLAPVVEAFYSIDFEVPGVFAGSVWLSCYSCW